MRTERKEPTKQQIEDYWTEIFARRTADKDLHKRDIFRLCSALEGQFYEHVFHRLASNRITYLPTIEEFSQSKRPYGNKDVPASILYRLGWDEKGYLSYRLPEFVNELCMKMHEEVLTWMTTDQEIFHQSMYDIKKNIGAIHLKLNEVEMPPPISYDEKE